jgi:hypothetical protein
MAQRVSEVIEEFPIQKLIVVDMHPRNRPESVFSTDDGSSMLQTHGDS